jgi:hypothetical protein
VDARTSAGPFASDHAQSAGTISVATPGAERAAAIAAAVSTATSAAADDMRTHADAGRARPSMSVCSGASLRRCQVACSPTRQTSGVPARRALCRFAMPLARPGPRCSKASAGRPAMRP